MLQLVFNDIIAKDRCILTDTSALHPTKQTRRTLFFLEKAVFYLKIYTRFPRKSCISRLRQLNDSDYLRKSYAM